MAHFSDYLENVIINHLLRNQAFTPPANIYVALFTADTGLESNNPSAEVSGGAYVRREIVLTAPTTPGESENNADIEFPEATADWGILTHLAIVDHLSNTTWGTNVNVLMWGPLAATREIKTGDTFKFPAGDVDVSND